MVGRGISTGQHTVAIRDATRHDIGQQRRLTLALAEYKGYLRGRHLGESRIEHGKVGCIGFKIADEVRVLDYQGSCLCGTVRVRVTGPIENIVHCHCSLCRKSSGTAYATNGFVESLAFRIEQGSDAIGSFEFKPGKRRYFCSGCGSPVYSASEDDPKRVRVRIGLLDTDILERPIGHTFVSSRASWDSLDANLPRYQEYEPGRYSGEQRAEPEHGANRTSETEPAFPMGDRVENSAPRRLPTGRPLTGRTVRLLRPHASRDGPELFAATHRGDIDPGQWIYMPYGPFESEGEMVEWLEELADSDDPRFYVVHSVADARPLGMASLLNIRPDHGCVEIGHIWYALHAQRSAVNTEAVYLLLKECFEDLGYRRVEWKCDALNSRSVGAAQRLGFKFEGSFRQHYIVKGRNRDTAWFSMLDREWPVKKSRFEAVLYDRTCNASLTQLNTQAD